MNTPMPKETEYACEGSDGVRYIITIKLNINNITFIIIKEGKLPRKRFEVKYDYETLTKISKWFALFDSLAAIAVEICFLFEERKFKLQEDTDKIYLHLLIKLRYVDELKLEISQCLLKQEDIIGDLCHSFNQMQTAMLVLKDKFDLIEKSPLFQKIVDKVIPIKESQVFPDATFLETLKQKISTTQEVCFKLLHSTSIDGDSSTAFHTNCDQKGPTLVLIKSAKNNMFGGYTDINWDQSGSNKSSANCFLFSFNQQKIYPSSKTGFSILCNSANGPTFGGNAGYDLKIGPNCFVYNSNTVGFFNYSNGSSYELAKESAFTVKEMDVFQVTLTNKA